MDQIFNSSSFYITILLIIGLAGLGCWYFLRRKRNFQAIETILENAQIPFFKLGLPELEKEVARSRRFNRVFSLIVICINDSLGKSNSHSINVIDFVMLGPIIRKTLRSTDLIMYDKDNLRFIVLLPETDYVQSTQMVERFKQLLGNDLFKQIKFQAVTFPKDGLIVDDLITKALQNSNPSFSVEYKSTV
jgi:GGDEF domain-containing protein